MFDLSGRLPVVISAALCACWSAVAFAQQSIPLTLAEAEDIALADEPGAAVLLARSQAMAERSSDMKSTLWARGAAFPLPLPWVSRAVTFRRSYSWTCSSSRNQ